MLADRTISEDLRNLVHCIKAGTECIDNSLILLVLLKLLN